MSSDSGREAGPAPAAGERKGASCAGHFGVFAAPGARSVLHAADDVARLCAVASKQARFGERAAGCELTERLRPPGRVESSDEAHGEREPEPPRVVRGTTARARAHSGVRRRGRDPDQSLLRRVKARVGPRPTTSVVGLGPPSEPLRRSARDPEPGSPGEGGAQTPREWRARRGESQREATCGASGNGKKAMAAVTRYGCWRGEFFEGCESVAGKTRARTALPPGGTGDSRRKRGEPHGRQRDATSPQHPGGASRQGGEKPRRRNVIGQVALLDRREPQGSWE